MTYVTEENATIRAHMLDAETQDTTMNTAQAIDVCRCHADPEEAAEDLEEEGCSYAVARQALRCVFGYDVLGR